MIALILIVLVVQIFICAYIRDLFKHIELFHRETLEKERAERADLNSRFMSRDLAEYNYNSQGKVPEKRKPPVNFLQAARENALMQSSLENSSFGGGDD